MAMTTDTISVKTDADSVAPLARRFLWADSAKSVNKLIFGLIGLCVFLFAMDFFWHRHVKVPGEELYGFHAIAGFVSFTVIVIGARLLRVIIRRDENYYAPNGVDAEEYPDTGTERCAHADAAPESLSSFLDQLMGRESTTDKDQTHSNGRDGAST